MGICTLRCCSAGLSPPSATRCQPRPFQEQFVFNFVFFFVCLFVTIIMMSGKVWTPTLLKSEHGLAASLKLSWPSWLTGEGRRAMRYSKFKNLSTYRGKGADWGEKKAGGNFSGQQGGTYINQLHRKLLTKVQRELELCWQFMRIIAREWNHRYLMFNWRLWAVWRDTRWTS